MCARRRRFSDTIVGVYSRIYYGGNVKTDDKVVELVPKSVVDEEARKAALRDEIHEFIGMFAAAAEAYNATSFAAVCVSDVGEPIGTFTSLDTSLLPLIGALEGVKQEMIEIVAESMYDDEEEE